MLRRSQTLEQQQHEEQIHMQFDPPPTAPIAHDAGHGSSSSSMLGRVKGFYQDVVKPVSTEAMAGLHLVGGLEKVEERITEGLHDPKRFPEVTRVAEVRRGLDLCQDEQRFVIARKTKMRDAFSQVPWLEPGRRRS